MPDGRTIDHRGPRRERHGRQNPDVEVFTPSPDLDGVGTITKAGSDPGTAFLGDYYPHMFWMPSGRGAGRRAVHDRRPFFIDQPAIPTADAARTCRTWRSGATWGTAVLEPRRARTASTTVLEIGGSDTDRHRSYENAPRDGDDARASTRRTPARAGRPAVAEPRAARIPTPCCCPTARWSPSAAASAATVTPARAVDVQRRPEAGRALEPGDADVDARARASARAARTTRRQCCCPTGACSRPATTINGASARPARTRHRRDLRAAVPASTAPRPTIDAARRPRVGWNTEFTVDDADERRHAGRAGGARAP